MHWFNKAGRCKGATVVEEFAVLHSLVFAGEHYTRAKHIVELGIYYGRTTVTLATACKELGIRLTAVDKFEIRPETEAVARQNLVDADVADVVDIVKADSAATGKAWDKGPIALIFVDAGHDYESVSNDITAWYPHIATKGYVVLHDLDRYGVWKIQREMVANYSVTEVGVVRLTAIYRKEG